MPLMDWNDGLSIHVDFVDDDHKYLLHLLNSLGDAVRENHGNEALGKILQELLYYTGYHFSREEEFMSEINYPHLFTHQQIHNKFAREVRTVFEEHKAGKPVLTTSVLDMMKGWLINHIALEDKRISLFLNPPAIKTFDELNDPQV